MNSMIDMLHKTMDAAVERHQVLANNLANVNTPGYRRQDLVFKDAFSQAIEAQKHVSSKVAWQGVTPELFEDTRSIARPDGNNVSTQTELAEMSQNEIFYRTMTKIISAKLQTLRKATASQ